MRQAMFFKHLAITRKIAAISLLSYLCVAAKSVLLPNPLVAQKSSGGGVIPASYDQHEQLTDTTNSKRMEAVVVTAMGIKREKKSLGYSVQEIKGSAVSDVKDQNFVNSLSGKVSGLEIRQNNSMGGSSNVVIRGFSSLTGNNQALFVVDGVPIDNTNRNDANQLAGGGGYDYGNSASDINPDDIESITVLKSAAATALYGSRASNGAILVTTKKHIRERLSITVSSSYTAGLYNPQTFVKYQKEYGAGYAGAIGNADFHSLSSAELANMGLPAGTSGMAVNTNNDASMGPMFDPNRRVYQYNAAVPGSAHFGQATPWTAAANDPNKFFQLSNTFSNYVAIENANSKGSFKLSYTRFDQTGILPNSKLDKNVVYANVNYKLTKRLSASVISNFVNQNTRGRFSTGYSDNIITGFRQWWPVNVDVLEQKRLYEQTRQNASWNQQNLAAPLGTRPVYWDNPYWNRFENYSTDTRNRFYGSAELNYKISKKFNVRAQVTYDIYSTLMEERVAIGSNAVSSYRRQNVNYSEINYNGFFTYTDRYKGGFDMNATFGTNIRVTKNNFIDAGTQGGLVYKDLYALSNSVNPLVPPVEFYEPIQVNGFFANVSLGWKSQLYLDLTGRVDQASSLPVNNNAYFYPSVSLGYIFTETMRRAGVRADWIDFGKVRANYAQVGNFAPPLQVFNTFVPGGGSGNTSFNGVPMLALPATRQNDQLLPEKTRSWEVGIEMSFFKHRIRFDVDYYRKNTLDQILPVAVSTATGYSQKYVNSGNVLNHGVELSFGVRPVVTRDFSWDIDVNWTKNISKVISLFEGVDNLQLAAFQGGVSLNATVGRPYGELKGTDYVYAPDGQRVVGEDGRYLRTERQDQNIGNITPKWWAGFRNTLKYKNFAFSFLIDMRWGGDVYSLDMGYGMDTGIPEMSAGKNDLGNPVRLPLAQGGGVVLPGVVQTRDGQYVPNTKRVAYGTGGYGLFGNNHLPGKAFIYDASYVKLREISLSYSFAKKLLPKALQGVTIAFICKNPVIIFKNLPYADPEDGLSFGNVQGFQSGAMPSVREFGGKVTLKF